MKVSEAVAGIKADASTVWKDDNVCVVRRDQLATLLASHEALRLAGEKVNIEAPLGRAYFEALKALSLAVEEASK